MSELMKAIIVYGKGDARIEDIEIPEAKDKEVLVKVEYAAICPSDMRYYLGTKEVVKPMILGHEGSGEIIKIGKEVKRFKKGDKVVINSDYKCNKCYYCLKGKQNFCLNQFNSDGCFAQYKVVPEESLYLIPEGTNLFEASNTEPLACVLNGSERASINIGSTVAIIGAGPIGLLHLQVAKLKGASKIIVFEPLELRRNLALKLGATQVFGGYNKEQIENIKEITDSKLFDSVIVTIGVAKVMEEALDLVGNNGTLMYFAGIHPNKPLNIDSNLIHYRQITITGSSDYPLELFNTSLKLISTGQVQIEPIVSDVFSINEGKEAFENSVNKTALKTIIKMFED